MNTFSQFHLDSLDRSTYILQGFFLRVFYLYSLNNLYNFIILALSALNHIDFKHLVGQASKHCFNFRCLKKHMLNLLLIFLDLLSKIIFFEFLFIVKLTPSMPALVRNYWKKNEVSPEWFPNKPQPCTFPYIKISTQPLHNTLCKNMMSFTIRFLMTSMY